jgi:hypothetical protein
MLSIIGYLRSTSPSRRHQRISVREEWTFVRSHACQQGEGAGSIRISPLLVSYLFREMHHPLRGQISGNVAKLIGGDWGRDVIYSK